MTTSVVHPRRGPKRWFPKQWRDRIQLYNHNDNFDRQKEEAYAEMDKDGFGYWTVFTAGAGFFTGAYDIFAVNTVVPLIEIVYWKGRMPSHTQLAISMASLIGTLFGQIILGILGDRYGRKKMFYRLIVGLMVGTICFALVSRGAQNSLDVLALIIFWRLWMGCFIGGDYPLSATITAEFAPKRHRGRMLSTVFFAQPLGQLLACIVSLITTSALRDGISGVSLTDCTGQCLHTADIAWRWIVGFGAIPPTVALVLRSYIPESPRWLLEVERNPMGLDAAAYPKEKYYADPLLDDEIDLGSSHSIADDGFVPAQHGAVMEYELDDQGDQSNRHQVLLSPKPFESRPGSSTVQAWSERSGGTANDHSPRTRPVVPEDEFNDGSQAREPELDAITHVPGQDLNTPVQLGPPYIAHTPESPSGLAADPNGHHESPSSDATVPQPQLQSWTDFRKEFGEYLFGETPWTLNRLWLCLTFQDKHFFDGSWTDLAGLSSTWFLLDFGFYFLIVNSSKLMSKIWAKDDPDDVYTVVSQYPWRIIASTSVGAVAGGAVFIAMARKRWMLQFWGFSVLVAFFVIVGVVFIKLIGGRYFAVFIVLYCLCHFAFNLGPNTSTFVIAAEVFPTKFRASCHGIAAAAGKFGSILTQIFLSETKINGKGVNDARSNWLGWALIIQAVMMLAGAMITWWWVPDPCDIDGNPRSLEDLGRGKQWRKAKEREEKEERAQRQSRQH